MHTFIFISLLIIAFVGRALSKTLASQRWVLIVLAMLLFFMGGIWFFPFVKEKQSVLLLISIINQLSCLAFIVGADFRNLRQKSSEWKKFSAIVISTLVGFFSVIFSTFWVKLLVQIGVEHDKQEMVSLLVYEEGGVQLITITFVVLIAPIVEELLFRGLLLPSLVENLDEGFAIVLTGLLFGLMHLESWTSVPPLIVFGILLGILRQRYNSVVPAIIAHFINNLVVVCSLMLF